MEVACSESPDTDLGAQSSNYNSSIVSAYRSQNLVSCLYFVDYSARYP